MTAVLWLGLREEKIADQFNINKDSVYTEIKAYGLTEATLSDITLLGSESFINRDTKLPS